MTGLRKPLTTRNSGLTPSANLRPENDTYRKYYKRKGASSWTVATLSEWRQLIRYDLWQVYCHLWGAATCAEFPQQVIRAAYKHGLEAFQRGVGINPYYGGGEAVAWIRGYCKATLNPILAGPPRAAPPIVSFLTVQREYTARRKVSRAAKDRRLATLNRQAQRSIKKDPTNIDEYGHAWGGMMRYQPNGWPSKSQWVRRMEESIAGRNSITRIAFDSSYGDKAPSSSTGSNTGGGQKRIKRSCQSEPPIKQSMLPNILPYHIAWNGLRPLSYRAILWTHYVPIVEHTEKLRLLNVTDDIYMSWLASAQRKIDQEICELPEPAPEPPKPVPGSGPLWPCRIFASIHKFSIRHSGADTESRGPVLQFPLSPLFDGFRMPICEDENNNYIFRLPGGEIYAILAKRDYNGFLPDEAREFLDFAYENMSVEKCNQQT